MKSHDFGQFLLNSSTLSEVQLAELVRTEKFSKPTLAVKALFLRLVSAAELTELFRHKLKYDKGFSSDTEKNFQPRRFVEKYDPLVKNFITQRKAAHALELDSGQSFWFAQTLVDKGIANFIKLEHIFDAYNRLEVPPFEKSFCAYYELKRDEQKADYPFALDVAMATHEFLSENLSTTIILLPPSEQKENSLMGATVRISGSMPVTVGIFAKEKVFKKIAETYAEEVYDSREDIFDAVSELLNVFTGIFTIHIASTLGVEEIPELPRFGNITRKINAMKMLADVGEFYLYVGQEEIFSVE